MFGEGRRRGKGPAGIRDDGGGGDGVKGGEGGVMMGRG